MNRIYIFRGKTNKKSILVNSHSGAGLTLFYRSSPILVILNLYLYGYYNGETGLCRTVVAGRSDRSVYTATMISII